MGSSFGKLFQISSFGESHGPGIGVVIEGLPAGMPIDLDALEAQLARRRPGQSLYTSPRQEDDRVEVLSGLDADGRCSGGPIALWTRNRDQKIQDYQNLKEVYRPSHADYTYRMKYGLAIESGSGRASARETWARVAAGALAEQYLRLCLPTWNLFAFVSQVGPERDLWPNLSDPSDRSAGLDRKQIDHSPVRARNEDFDLRFRKRIEDAKAAGDSVGGTISLIAQGIPPGLGEPVFDKLEADLAKAMLSIPACRGFEIGSGFDGVSLRGSEHNDAFIPGDEKQIKTLTNRSGGVQGGISNGADLVLRVAFKPPASIALPQSSVDRSGEAVTLPGIQGRHDPCVLPRAVPIVEAMAAIVLCDHFLRQCALESARSAQKSAGSAYDKLK